MRNNLSVLNVYKKKTTKSEIVTQLLYGETFKKIKKKGKWIKIKNDYDNYKGYIKNKSFPENQKNTHKVYNLKVILGGSFLFLTTICQLCIKLQYEKKHILIITYYKFIC